MLNIYVDRQARERAEAYDSKTNEYFKFEIRRTQRTYYAVLWEYQKLKTLPNVGAHLVCEVWYQRRPESVVPSQARKRLRKVSEEVLRVYVTQFCTSSLVRVAVTV